MGDRLVLPSIRRGAFPTLATVFLWLVLLFGFRVYLQAYVSTAFAEAEVSSWRQYDLADGVRASDGFKMFLTHIYFYVMWIPVLIFACVGAEACAESFGRLEVYRDETGYATRIVKFDYSFPFSRHKKIFPIERITAVECSQGSLDRLFGVGRVVITASSFTSGSAQSIAVSIDGVEDPDAVAESFKWLIRPHEGLRVSVASQPDSTEKQV